jgi:chemotaxis protein methyltransferase CheR
MIGLDDVLYSKFSALIKEKVGIEYGPDQKNLLNNRLMALLLANKIENFHEYFELISNDEKGNYLTEFIAKITTNHTYFYREKSHFEFLESRIFREHEEDITHRNKKELRYWVAASSTGEEPYMLAMMLKNHFVDRNIIPVKVLATDISRKVVEKATEGKYKRSEVDKLPEYYVQSFFNTVESKFFEVKQEVKDLVTFRVLNLVRESFPFQGKFDVIFIRNVMIYFDEETRRKLISQLYDLLNDNGYLFIGQTESIHFKINKFNQVFPSVFKKDI